MTIEKEIDKDLKLAEKKKDKALAEDPSVLKQIKIGLEYRKERALAKLKDKTKDTLSKGKLDKLNLKNKIYGAIDLLKNKID